MQQPNIELKKPEYLQYDFMYTEFKNYVAGEFIARW
jgi:hypothetical protein